MDERLQFVARRPAAEAMAELSRPPPIFFSSKRASKNLSRSSTERPHEALDMKCPAEVYQPSPRPYTGLPDIDYPPRDKTIVVTRCGASVWAKRKSISVRSLPVRPSASRKYTTTFGW
jgi:hypothetical protein